MAGMSVVADSLSAIRFAKVRESDRDNTGLITDYQSEGEFPHFGNNDNRVDHLATLAGQHIHEQAAQVSDLSHALHTIILMITSNVVYGKNRQHAGRPRRREPFAPGANPMHGRDEHRASCFGRLIAKIPYRDAADGISLTTSMVPEGLGRVAKDRIQNLPGMLDAFFGVTGFHMNVKIESGNAARCDGSPGEVSATDDPCVGIRR